MTYPQPTHLHARLAAAYTRMASLRRCNDPSIISSRDRFAGIDKAAAEISSISDEIAAWHRKNAAIAA